MIDQNTLLLGVPSTGEASVFLVGVLATAPPRNRKIVISNSGGSVARRGGMNSLMVYSIGQVPTAKIESPHK
jgi:hypothetical protein